MRHLNRTHGVDITAMKEQFDSNLVDIVYTQSDRQCADIHTKAFDSKDKWDWAMNQINVFDMNYFDMATINEQRQLPPADPLHADPAQVAMATPYNAKYKHSVHIIQDPPYGRWIRVELDAKTFFTTWTQPASEHHGPDKVPGGDDGDGCGLSRASLVAEAPSTDTLAATPPEWNMVYRRVTKDLDSDEVIEDIYDEHPKWGDKRFMHRALHEAPKNTCTILYIKGKEHPPETTTTPDGGPGQTAPLPPRDGGPNKVAAPSTTPEIKIKKCNSDAIIPKKATPLSAGFDIHAIKDQVIPARERKVVDTGIIALAPPGSYIRIAPRSGLATKHGIDIAAGVVDADYRGEIKAVLVNNSDTPFSIKKGDRIAQMILEKIDHSPVCKEVYEVDQTLRGTGHFGHTDAKGKDTAPAVSTPNTTPTNTHADSPPVPKTHIARDRSPGTSTTHEDSTAQHSTAGTGRKEKGKTKPTDREILLDLLKDTDYHGLHRRPQRIIIELCCGHDSLLGSSKGPHSDGCLVIRITESDDFNSEYAINKILAVLRYFSGVPTLIWIAFPCTGGSTYNVGINWYNGNLLTQQKIKQHWRDYRRFWATYTDRILPQVDKNRKHVRQGIELPDSCDYWRWTSGGLCMD